ncbi:helix-turn-helix domain-containing protein [Streptomyces gamaensis]|uniref:Helix-turn-helix domain-containing protein n=1 Tax=Streptomyces gamaensis TaxID=1763542 RepID=A0ABW0Z8S8_9ACTN
MPQKSPTIRQKRLGAELRKLREAAGMSGEAAAEALECGQAKISRIETGANGIRPFELRGLLSAYGVTDRDLIETLVELAKEGRRPGWWSRYAQSFPGIADLAHLEAHAVVVQTWQTVLVPGLLQTADYMRALFRGGRYGYDAAEAEHAVAARTARQQVLASADAPRLSAVVYEAVLRAEVGGPAVMRGQLRHLAALADSERVRLRVLPFAAGAHGGFDGPFVVYGLEPADMDVVLMDGLAGPQYLDRQADVRRFRELFASLSAAALDPESSAGLLRRLASRS